MAVTNALPQVPHLGESIRMRKIVKKFKTVAGDVTVLKGVDAEFHPGEFVGVVGKSGSGKSTLVNMLTGIDKPTSGEVQIGDTLVHKLSESDRSRWRGLNLGIVFQFYQLLPVLSLLENTMLPMDIAGKIPPTERESRALGLLRQVGLEHDAHKLPAAVSGGQQQAAAIARALANDPPFIIADEPTGNLDSRTAESIFSIFEGLAAQGKTILVVTHDPQLAQRTTRTLLLCDGEVIHPAVAAALPWLSHPQMLRATHHSRLVHLEAGQSLVKTGETLEGVFVIVSGTLEQTHAESGAPLRLGANRILGHNAFLMGRPARTEAAAVEPSEVLLLDGTVYQDLAAHSNLRAELAKTGEDWL